MKHPKRGINQDQHERRTQFQPYHKDIFRNTLNPKFKDNPLFLNTHYTKKQREHHPYLINNNIFLDGLVSLNKQSIGYQEKRYCINAPNILKQHRLDGLASLILQSVPPLYIIGMFGGG
jgi:hypothetical protein